MLRLYHKLLTNCTLGHVAQYGGELVAFRACSVCRCIALHRVLHLLQDCWQSKHPCLSFTPGKQLRGNPMGGAMLTQMTCAYRRTHQVDLARYRLPLFQVSLVTLNFSAHVLEHLLSGLRINKSFAQPWEHPRYASLEGTLIKHAIWRIIMMGLADQRLWSGRGM